MRRQHLAGGALAEAPQTRSDIGAHVGRQTLQEEVQLAVGLEGVLGAREDPERRGSCGIIIVPGRGTYVRGCGSKSEFESARFYFWAIRCGRFSQPDKKLSGNSAIWAQGMTFLKRPDRPGSAVAKDSGLIGDDEAQIAKESLCQSDQLTAARPDNIQGDHDRAGIGGLVGQRGLGS